MRILSDNRILILPVPCGSPHATNSTSKSPGLLLPSQKMVTESKVASAYPKLMGCGQVGGSNSSAPISTPLAPGRGLASPSISTVIPADPSPTSFGNEPIICKSSLESNCGLPSKEELLYKLCTV